MPTNYWPPSVSLTCIAAMCDSRVSRGTTLSLSLDPFATRYALDHVVDKLTAEVPSLGARLREALDACDWRTSQAYEPAGHGQAGAVLYRHAE